MSIRLVFDLVREGCSRTQEVLVDRVVVAGWTGRNQADVDRHIAELAEIGVQAPPTVPVYYRVAPSLLTQENRITVVGAETSGEVEFYLLVTTEGVFVGVGSDHTDRKVEAYDVTVSKQMCGKPVSRRVWPLDEVKGHWDTLELQSHVLRRGERRVYQSGTLEALLPPDILLRRYLQGQPMRPGMLMFGGTVPVIGGVSGGERFEVSLFDPSSGNRLEHAYAVDVVPPYEAH
jgi:hypothetical protein